MLFLLLIILLYIYIYAMIDVYYHYKRFKLHDIAPYDSAWAFHVIILLWFIIIYYGCSFQLAEHYINQNNSIDIYQPYFTDPSCQKMQTLAPSFRTVAVMSDPREPTRPVQNISWSPDQGTLVAVSYADMRFQMTDPDTSSDSFIFDLGERAEKPFQTQLLFNNA